MAREMHPTMTIPQRVIHRMNARVIISGEGRANDLPREVETDRQGEGVDDSHETAWPEEVARYGLARRRGGRDAQDSMEVLLHMSGVAESAGGRGLSLHHVSM